MGDVAVAVHVVLPPQVAADNKKSSSLFTYMKHFCDRCIKIFCTLLNEKPLDCFSLIFSFTEVDLFRLRRKSSLFLPALQMIQEL